MKDSHHVERRSGKDRRKRPTNPLTLNSLRGSRKWGRRKDDRTVLFYVDRYGPKAVLAFLSAIVLSTLDAFLTLRLTCAGAEELNPIMDFFLQQGPLPFLLAKYTLTGSALTFLLVHKNYPLIPGKLSMKGILLVVPILYAVLIIYELTLIFRCNL